MAPVNGISASFVHLHCSVECTGSCTSKKKKKERNYSLSTLVSSLTLNPHHFKHP